MRFKKYLTETEIKFEKVKNAFKDYDYKFDKYTLRKVPSNFSTNSQGNPKMIWKIYVDKKGPLEMEYPNLAKAKKTLGEIIQRLKEDITIPINVGDVILGGKFKNKRITVKEIGKNEKGDITINGKPLLKFRIIPKDEQTEGIDEYKVLQPIKPKPDKKSWNQLDQYETKKVKAFLKKKGIPLTDVYRILGKYSSTNYNAERQSNINIELLNYETISIVVNLKTGETNYE